MQCFDLNEEENTCTCRYLLYTYIHVSVVPILGFAYNLIQIQIGTMEIFILQSSTKLLKSNSSKIRSDSDFILCIYTNNFSVRHAPKVCQ